MIGLILGIICGLFLLFDSHPDKLFLVLMGLSTIISAFRCYIFEKHDKLQKELK